MGKWSVPVPLAVVSVPVAVAAGGSAVTGPAGPVPSFVTHGTRIGPTATAIGAGVRAGAAVAIVGHRVVVVVKPRRSGAVVRGLKYIRIDNSQLDLQKRGRTAELTIFKSLT